MPNRFFCPRPEYPRPDRQRGTAEGEDWLNLNGPWQFRFDGDRRGMEEKWFAPGGPEWREQILVPYCWESLAAWGEGDAAGNDNYYSTRIFRNPLEVTRANHRSAPRYEVGWYRRAVSIPAHDCWKGKRVILTIGAADFFTDAWCNGVHLGHHEGGYTPFEFDLTEALHGGPDSREGLLVLRVEDPMNNSEQPVGKQWRWYTTTSGIWQTVFIEPRSPTFIESFRFVANLEQGSIECAVQCAQADDQCEVELLILPPVPGERLAYADYEEQLASPAETVGTRDPPQGEVLPVRQGAARREIKLTCVRWWDPNEPYLYPAILRLRRGGALLDTVRTYFGMRQIDFALSKLSGAPTALRVNGVARYLRGALYQSYFPDGVYTATSVETLKNDLVAARRFGFTFLRVHIKIDDPLLLYWADRLGLLLMADFPNFGEGGDTPLGRRRFETMMREAIARDFNHPAIFAWCLFNETWGFGGQMTFAELLGDLKLATPSAPPTPPADWSSPQEWVQRMWELAKQLDPTRLVEDMSVCHWDHLEYYLHCDTDINSWHFYINDYAKAKAHIDKVVSSTFVGSSFNYVKGFIHKGQPLINSEYGGIGALDGDRDISWSFKFLTNELRRHQQIAAYIYTELHDVEWEYNGFLNYDRTPKEFGYDPRIVNESNALPIDSPPVRQSAPGESVRLEVSSAHYSTQRQHGVRLDWELGGIDTSGRFLPDLARGRVPIPFPHRKVAHAHTLEFRLPDRTMLCTLLVSACNGDGVIVAQNFAHFFVTSGYPPAREGIDGRLLLRGAPGEEAAALWSLGCSDRKSARETDTCYGLGHGFFEWALPLERSELARVLRLRVLCEASSHRVDTPQTDQSQHPTTLQIFLNEVRLYEAVLPNHPHDSRGVLSYLRGAPGAYGYLVHAIAEGPLLRQVLENGREDALRLRLAVPAEALAQGGLTLYGGQSGRFPLPPTVILEYSRPASAAA